MKKIIFFLFLFIGSYSYSQVKVDSSGGIIATGNYPVAVNNDIKSGIHDVQTLTDRDAIPANFRRLGMLAYVIDSLKYYQLKTGITNSDWVEFVSGTANIVMADTFYVQIPLYVDSSSGRKVLKIQHDDGLLTSPAITWSGQGLTYDIPAIPFYKNGNFYTSRDTSITLDSSDLVNPRTDIFAVDTLNGGIALKITGQASPSALTPQVDPASQIALTSGMMLNVGDTVPPNINSDLVYNENIEWSSSKSASVTADFNNVDNPYNGIKATYVSSYNKGNVAWVRSSAMSSTSDMLIKFHFYSNGAFLNKLRIDVRNVFTTVGSTYLNISNLNPNDSNHYQTVLVPFSQLKIPSGTQFDRLVFNNIGTDTSGAKGYYIDYVQLQAGVPNIPVSTGCDTCIVAVKTNADSTQQIFIRANGDIAAIFNFNSGSTGNPTEPGWSLNGNSATVDSNFIGTKDNTSLKIKTNNILSGWIDLINRNTSLGYNSLVSNNADGGAGGANGRYNTAIGYWALKANTTGRNNTSIGAPSLLANTTGYDNTAIGVSSLFSNTTGWYNVAIGRDAMRLTTTGVSNTAIGTAALNDNTTGTFNTAIGRDALHEQTTQSYNIGLGYLAGIGKTDSSTMYVSDSTHHLYFKLDSAAGTAPSIIGKDNNGYWHTYTNSADGSGWSLTGNTGTTSSNFIGTTDDKALNFRINNIPSGIIDSSLGKTAFGFRALSMNISTTNNTAFGWKALANSNGNTNTGIGYQALYNTTTGSGNQAFGANVLYSNTTGLYNTGVGYQALYYNTDGSYNTSVGYLSLNNAIGSYNTALGKGALYTTIGQSNIGLGISAGRADTISSNTLFISDSTFHFKMKLDSAAGAAPSVIGKDANGYWHTYANSGEGSTPSLQQAFDKSVENEDDPTINGHGNSLTVDSLSGFNLHANNGANISTTEAGVGVRYLGDTASAEISTYGNDDGGSIVSINVENNTIAHRILTYTDRIELSSASDVIDNYHTKVLIQKADTLLSPPTYIWGADGDTLKKVEFHIDSTVTLSSGTITVSDTRIKTGARIFVSVNTPSGTQGFLSVPVGDIIDETSFVINSTSATDNSTVNYQIINP